MSTESTIIIRARKALAEDAEIDIHIPEYILRQDFFFEDGNSSNSIAKWFSDCRDRGIKDIKLSPPEKTIERHPFGAAYEHTDIVCIWEGEKTSRFVRTEKWHDEKGSIVFHESDYMGDYKELISANNNTEEYKQVLLEIKTLAERLNCKYFARQFDIAHSILDGTVTPNHENAPYYIRDLPDELKNIMLARKYSYVFGGMGSWNDEPPGISETMGLEDEYERLTNDLIMNMRKSLFYVTNTCFTKV